MKKPWWVYLVTTFMVVAGVLFFRITWDMVTAEPAQDVDVWASLPESAYTGPQEFDIIVVVTNDGDKPVKFDGTVFMKTGSHHPVKPSQGTETYWEECKAGWGCKLWWRGNVQPHDVETFVIPAIMVPELPPGTHEFLEVLLEIDGKQFEFVKTLTVE